MTSRHTMKIDGYTVAFREEETILQAAERYEIYIPTLCYLKGLSPTANCGICAVEEEGSGELLTACNQAPREGMAVRTDSDRVLDTRREILEQLLASGDHDYCMACPGTGECSLQELAYSEYQISSNDLPKQPVSSMGEEEEMTPFIRYDPSKCIHCWCCVRADREIVVNNALSVGEREKTDKLVASGDRPLKDSDCVFCGECVQKCPTGALAPEGAENRPYTWETSKIRTTCPYCGVGCQIQLHVKDNRIHKVTGVEEASPNRGSLCVKGRYGFEFVNSSERLTKPLIKENGHFREAEWDEALQACASGFKNIKEQYSPDSLGVLCSAKITNEENYLLQKLTRGVLGTNNIDHCARL